MFPEGAFIVREKNANGSANRAGLENPIKNVNESREGSTTVTGATRIGIGTVIEIEIGTKIACATMIAKIVTVIGTETGTKIRKRTGIEAESGTEIETATGNETRAETGTGTATSIGTESVNEIEAGTETGIGTEIEIVTGIERGIGIGENEVHDAVRTDAMMTAETTGRTIGGMIGETAGEMIAEIVDGTGTEVMLDEIETRFRLIAMYLVGERHRGSSSDCHLHMGARAGGSSRKFVRFRQELRC